MLSNDSFQEFIPEHLLVVRRGRRPRRQTGSTCRLGLRGTESGQGGHAAGAPPRRPKRKASTARRLDDSGKSPSRGRRLPERRGQERSCDRQGARQATGGVRRLPGARHLRGQLRTDTAPESVEPGPGLLSRGVEAEPKPRTDQHAAGVPEFHHRAPTRCGGHSTSWEFTSRRYGAEAEGVRCIPLKSMGDPAPRSPRERLDLNEPMIFAVQEYDTPRRGIVLALGSRRDAETGYQITLVVRWEDDERLTISNTTTMKPAEASVAARRSNSAKRKGAGQEDPWKRKAQSQEPEGFRQARHQQRRAP